MSRDTPDQRRATIERATSETRTRVEIDLHAAAAAAEINTGIGFLDHMLTALAVHSGVALKLSCDGDLHIDDHHTAEDCALALGLAIDGALGDRRGIARFASAYAPLDESLARVVIDLCARPHATVDLGLRREAIGGLATENITHFLVSLAMNARITLHADVVRGENDHHKAEAAFKALALALRTALARTGRDGAASTKGTLA